MKKRVINASLHIIVSDTIRRVKNREFDALSLSIIFYLLDNLYAAFGCTIAINRSFTIFSGFGLARDKAHGR